MACCIGLAQCGFPADEDVIAQADRLVAEAAEAGADVVVFPEDLMSPRPLTAAELRVISQPLDGPFANAMADMADRYGVWLVYTMYEQNAAGGAPYNVAVVVDADGQVRGTYRKCHLYDAHGVLESERTQAGDALFGPIRTPFGTLGLGICYDLRFPEVARAAACQGCDLLVFPSAWHDGPQKLEHWQTLLRARAIENELFVVGVCKAGERYVGHSLVADPLGTVLAQVPDKAEQLVMCQIDLGQVAQARDAMPALTHRRPTLYG